MQGGTCAFAQVDIETAKAYFRQPVVVEHYAHAANAVGLWASEEKVFTRLFKQEDSLVELGCGAGRIALGLWELGYKHLLGLDYSREMIAEARRINQVLEYGIAYQVGDATRLAFEDNTFDGAIFGFNGLQQIPGRENRRRAMAEACRVIKPGGWFVFTGHDREVHGNKKLWRAQRDIWQRGGQHPDLEMFGDLFHAMPEGGHMFIYSASRQEVLEDIAAAGLRHEVDALRSELASEPARVRHFSDDTRFWVCQKPTLS